MTRQTIFRIAGAVAVFCIAIPPTDPGGDFHDLGFVWTTTHQVRLGQTALCLLGIAIAAWVIAGKPPSDKVDK